MEIQSSSVGLINPLVLGFLALSDSALAAARKEEVCATREGSAVARLLLIVGFLPLLSLLEANFFPMF